MIMKLKELFKKKVNYHEPDNDHPKVINFTKSMWGHACSIDGTSHNGFISLVSGHSMHRPNPGDYLIFRSQSKNPHGFRYKILKVEWCMDPQDMFFATCIFANTQTEEDRVEDTKNLLKGILAWNVICPISNENIIKVIKDNTGTKIDLDKVITTTDPDDLGRFRS